MKYTIDITDRKGKSFRVRVSLPFFLFNTTPENSTWKVLDEGFLKVRSGGCDCEKEWGLANADIFFYVGGKSGLNLKAFADCFGLVNSSGVGEVLQPWVLSLTPGRVAWALDE